MGAEDLNAIGGHCPRCGQEYRPGFVECTDCKLPLHPGRAPERGDWEEPGPPRGSWSRDDENGRADEELDDSGPEIPDPGEMVRVGAFRRREAILVSGLLESSDIPVWLDPDPRRMSSAYAEVLDPLFTVLVPEDRLDEARALIEQRATHRFEENGG